MCYFSNPSQRIDTSSADVDWSSWSEDWPESHDHTDQSQWNDEQLSTAANNSWSHGTDKSRQNSSGSRNSTAKPAEKNLIDFDFFGEVNDGKKASTEAVGDGWDADVWADVDDDQWEPLETSAGKRD